MDALIEPEDEGVRLLSFTLRSPSSIRQKVAQSHSCLTPADAKFHKSNREARIIGLPVTFTVNGRVSPRCQEGLPTPVSNKVKLVKFELNDDKETTKINPINSDCPIAETMESKFECFEKQREEKMERMKKESQDWFSKVREENHKWRIGYANSTDFGSSFGGGSGQGFNDYATEDSMQRFFEEAQKNFSMGNQDLFTRFMQDNKDRFSKLLGDNESTSFFQDLGGIQRPTSLQSDFSEIMSEDSCNESVSINGQKFAKSNDQDKLDNANNVCHNGTNKKSSKPDTLKQSRSFKNGRRSTHMNGDFANGEKNRKGYVIEQTLDGASDPTNVLSSPVRVSCASRLSSQYQMSRSTFEYCGITNSYKFSTEQVTRSYGNGYESISESEDEEEDECESVEDATSTAGTASELEDEISIRDVDARSDSGCNLAAEYENKKDKIQQTLHKIATELLTTERTYVSILHLLDQVFAFRVDQENRVHNMFPQEVVSQMFCNLKSLYKLHHDFLLPLLEERLQKWDEDPRIGDIMKNFAPFLKMYTEFVRNYDNSMGLINAWYLKQPHFAQIMDEIHTTEECGHLTLQHHMLTPVQRVPRYQLLLKDYLKKLPENSPDRADTEKALDLVSTAAIHANDAMKKNDKIKKLLEIQEMIGGVVDLVSPSRELLKEGKIIKISARSGDHQERHLFLFNDLLLLCSQRRIANRVVSGPIFRVRARLEVEGLTVEEGDNLETANSFYIRHVGRSVELYTQTLEQKQAWMEAFAKAVHELNRRKSSLKSVEGLELGKRAPMFIKVESVTHCMSCGKHFNTFSFKWKHHCHACGIVACSKCLVHKLPLPCEKFRSCRVCNSCYEALSASMSPGLESSSVKTMSSSTATTPDSPPTGRSFVDSPESPVRHRSVLDIQPHDPGVMCGYLQLKARSRTWVRRWFALHADFVLYSFGSEEDDRALTSMPVPGYTVTQPSKSDSGADGRENVFKLSHQKKVYFFQTADSVELERWVSALQKASKAESLS